MSVYAEKRRGKPTGMFVAEVMRAGQTYRKRCHTLREAKQAETLMRKGSYVPKVASKEDKPLDVASVAREARALWHGTKDEKQSIARLEAAMGILGPTQPITNIDEAALDGMVSKLRSKRLSPKTVNRYLSGVSKALKFAARRGYISKVPDVPWQSEDEGRITFIEPHDEDRLIELIRRTRPDIALCLRVLVMTGMRVSELCRLKPTDLTNGGQSIYLGVNKNGRPRVAPLPEGLGASLTALVDRGVPTYRMIYDAFVRARKALGIDASITVHSLRHTTATRLTKARIPTATVKDMLGHRNVRTTLRYSHVDDEALRDAQSVLIRPEIAGELRGKSVEENDA